MHYFRPPPHAAVCNWNFWSVACLIMELISHAMCMWLTMHMQPAIPEKRNVTGCGPYCQIYEFLTEMLVITLFKKKFMIIMITFQLLCIQLSCFIAAMSSIKTFYWITESIPSTQLLLCWTSVVYSSIIIIFYFMLCYVSFIQIWHHFPTNCALVSNIYYLKQKFNSSFSR